MMLQLQVKNSFDGMKIGANADHNTFFVRIYWENPCSISSIVSDSKNFWREVKQIK